MKYDNIDLANGELSINKLWEVLLNCEETGKINLYKPIVDNEVISIGESLFSKREGIGVKIVDNTKI